MEKYPLRDCAEPRCMRRCRLVTWLLLDAKQHGPMLQHGRQAAGCRFLNPPQRSTGHAAWHCAAMLGRHNLNGARGIATHSRLALHVAVKDNTDVPRAACPIPSHTLSKHAVPQASTRVLVEENWHSYARD